MKAIAWSYLWWPGLDKEIKCAKSCMQCQAVKRSPPKALMDVANYIKKSLGSVSISILLVPFSGRIFSLLWMYIQMAGNYQNAHYNVFKDNCWIKEVTFCLWVNRAGCLRQWSSIYFRGVCNISEAKWKLFSIPPFLQWSSRTIC